MAIECTINGEARSIDADPSKPLLWILREDLSMPGTKFGCGAGLCGACTIMIDGQAVRSCLMPLAAAEGRAVTTIEHVATTKEGEALSRHWVETDVPQCGYCQAGQIMNAASLLVRNPSPDDGEIDAAMRGNLCRCSTYIRIKAAIRAAAEDLA